MVQDLKLLVLHEAEKTNICTDARKFVLSENNIRHWQKQKNGLLNTYSTGKVFHRSKKHIMTFTNVLFIVVQMSDKEFPMPAEVTQFKGREIWEKKNLPCQ